MRDGVETFAGKITVEALRIVAIALEMDDPSGFLRTVADRLDGKEEPSSNWNET